MKVICSIEHMLFVLFVLTFALSSISQRELPFIVLPSWVGYILICGVSAIITIDFINVIKYIKSKREAEK